MVWNRFRTRLFVAGFAGYAAVTVGCGPQNDLGKSTEWIQESEAVAEAAAIGGESESATPSIDKSLFQANDFQLELDEAKLAQLREQYDSDVAGITLQSTPTDVTRAFVHLLHVNDLQTAERLLTLKSRAVIFESGLELSPIAGSQAEYVIGDARYTTNNRDRAYVDCYVTDPELANSGDPAGGKYKVTWALRPESRFGWRVFGMVTEETGQPQMVSFENSQHAHAINQMYDGQGATGADNMRQARDANGESIR